MLTLRDKLRIPAMFVGIVLIALGGAVSCSELRKDGSEYVYRVGAWKDMNVAAGVHKEMDPWMMGAGLVLLAILYLTREK
jgi:hypothetical protein